LTRSPIAPRHAFIAFAAAALACGVHAFAQDTGDCDCKDIPAIQYRLEESKRARDSFQTALNSAQSNGLFSESAWNSITKTVQQNLDSMSHQFPRTPENGVPGETNGFWGWCGSVINTQYACMKQILDTHEAIHRQYCSQTAGMSFWKTGLDTMKRVLTEEIESYQAEITAEEQLLRALACKCARFALLVKHKSSVTYMQSGIKVDFQRELWGADPNGTESIGLKVPIVVQDSGQVGGFATGNEAGIGTILAPRAHISGKSDFDANLNVVASGQITSGSGCSSQGCRDDQLHVVLRGEQLGNMGQGVVHVGNRTFTKDVSPGGGDGQVEFDLPAYVGSRDAKTIPVPGTGVQAVIGVEIVSLGNFESFPGDSLLFAAKSCKQSH
jgi:hypothetical protein